VHKRINTHKRNNTKTQ